MLSTDGSSKPVVSILTDVNIAPGVVLTELWGINPKADKQKIKHMTNKGTALKTQDVVDCFEFALNRKRGVTIRDLVILPTNQDI